MSRFLVYLKPQGMLRDLRHEAADLESARKWVAQQLARKGDSLERNRLHDVKPLNSTVLEGYQADMEHPEEGCWWIHQVPR